MSELFEIEKWIWTDADFENMGWHDSNVHALAFSPEDHELLLDIDYIFQWVPPEQEETSFKFWVAPATLVFWNVYDLEFEIGSYSAGLAIDGIKREADGKPRNAVYINREIEWLWTIECQEGEIQLRSAGYSQFIRAAPQFNQQQKITLFSRGGYSFRKGQTDLIS